MQYGISSEILAIISENLKDKNYIIDRIGVLETPIPSTVALAKFSYPNQFTIIKRIERLINKKIKVKEIYKSKSNFDQPDQNFTGPF
jgi:pyruvate/2-oxoglutarate/acetoin dehydrogenase E1 component